MTESAAEAGRTDRYLSWDELRYRKPPAGLSCEEWWVGLKLHRMQTRQNLPLEDKKGDPFSYALSHMVLSLLHRVDMAAGGNLSAANRGTLSEADRNRYLMTSVMEESIMSSVLEGAVVTRAQAKELIRSKRRPGTAHERMITNNYRTMQLILEWRNEPITPERILQLHHSMTEGTLENPAKCGSLRTEEDRVRIEAAVSGEIVHTPPPADQLPQIIEKLCEFANGGGEPYIHPALRAIILHFWLAYAHPFVDGNGRTARSLFYWSMLNAGYWLFEYISISQEIFRHSKSYYTAFTNSEEDMNDLNYFIIDQLRTMCSAIEHVLEYARNKADEQKRLSISLRGMACFNYRQKALLAYLLEHPDAETSVAAHCREYSTVRQTARTDLAALVDAGLLSVHKVARTFIYAPVPDLRQRLEKL